MSDQIPTLHNLGMVPQSLFGGAVAFLTLAWLTVLLRIYVRGVMIKSFGWDDWTIMLAITAFTVQCVYIIKAAQMEMQPEKYNNLPGLSLIVIDIIIFSGSYALTSIFLKISLGLFFLRILVLPWQRNIIHASLILNTIYGLIYFGLVTFGCGAPTRFLEHTIQGKCISIKDVVIPASYTHTALNAAVDWIMAILPIFSLWNLNIPRATKFWAYFLLVLGAAGSIISLVRFGYVSGLLPGKDFFRQSAKFALYSTVEPGLGIAAVSLATLRPLFKKCLEGARSVSGTQRSGKGGRNTPSGVPDIQLKGLGSRSCERAGFRTFGEVRDEDREGVWCDISVEMDLEKGHVKR